MEFGFAKRLDAKSTSSVYLCWFGLILSLTAVLMRGLEDRFHY